ncbi:MAG: methyltransferase domain-containing protein [Synergistaceae bacterium]|jgi:2-polyprenyl-3-methyl-5-hydroxy-6-metoxy-1,4-benzoquinol methylase|nr:methyltransferase domain-containing protein [Synergistaceae bacterium]
MEQNQKEHNESLHGKWLVENDPVYQWGWGTPAGKRRAKRRGGLIANGANLRDGITALEIGCGTGLFTEIFAGYGAKILAVDLSPDLLEEARKRNLSGSQVEFLESPFEKCDARGPFDAIIGSSVLHHLDCNIAFKKIYDLLKQGGVLSFCEPNMLNPQVWFCLRFRQFFPNFSPDETAFVRWKLSRQLKSAGFSSVKIIPFDWLHPAVPELLIPFVRVLGYALERIPVIREFSGSLCIVARK